MAFPEYAEEAPVFAGSTAMVMHRNATGAHHLRNGPAHQSSWQASSCPCAGVTFDEFLVPGNSWTGLHPSRTLNATTVSGGALVSACLTACLPLTRHAAAAPSPAARACGGRSYVPPPPLPLPPPPALVAGVLPNGSMYGVFEVPGWQNSIPTFGTHWPMRIIPVFFAVDIGANSSTILASASTRQPQLSGSALIMVSSGTIYNVTIAPPPSSAAQRRQQRRPAAAWALLAAVVAQMLQV